VRRLRSSGPQELETPANQLLSRVALPLHLDDARMSSVPDRPETDRSSPPSAKRRHGTKLTYDDFLLFPDDGKRHELIDGEHYVTPAPNVRHQRILGRLFRILGAWLDERPTGEVFIAPLDVVISNVDIVEPDLLYVSHQRAAEVLLPKHLTGAPELVIEVASPATRQRDETIKRSLYERAGVVEYWVVDPEIDTIRVYRRHGDRFARPMELSREAGDVLTTPLLPGLDIPLDRVLR
jgi:Uma2 family endonuclease